MLKKHLLIVCCCWSFSAMASTIEYTPDDDFASEKTWFEAANWNVIKPQHAAKTSSPKKTHWWHKPVRKRHRRCNKPFDN